MGFNLLISSLLTGVADPLTSSLQVEVAHYRWADRTVDIYNKPTWGAPIPRRGIVSKSSKLVRRTNGSDAGELVQAAWTVVFPRPVPLDPRDKLVLPGSVTGPILNVDGVLDPGTEEVYATEVFLG